MCTYLVAFLGALVVSIAAQTHSPCPELFQYVSQQPGQWEGDVTLFTDSELHGVWVRLIFDSNSVDLKSVNNFGEIITDDHIEYLLKNRNYTLKAGEPTKVRLSMKYEGNKAPKLIGFRLNAKTVCPEHGGVFNWVENKDQSSNEFFLGDLNNKDFLASRPQTANVGSCGTVPLSPAGLPSGQKTTEGQWPWHASIYLTSGTKKEKICEATLVSPTHLLTAAHCVTAKNGENSLNPDTLKVRLGEHFTTSENKDLQEGSVLSITLHPGYNAINFDNDVAVIRLDKPVTFTDYVRPVCLWNESPDVQSILRRQGVVVGLGFDSEGRRSDRLTQAQMKLVSPDVCLNGKPELAPFLAGKSLCAGYAKGNAICVGESGSGFVFPSEGQKTVWQLRGLISVGAGLQNKLVCDETNYIVIIDLARHLKWIQASLA